MTELSGPGGTPTTRTPKKLLDLPVFPVQQRESNTGEIDRKMQDIMKLTGILEINGKVSFLVWFKVHFWNSYFHFELLSKTTF